MPPMPNDHVRMFAFSVADYEAMSATFPLSESFVIGVPSIRPKVRPSRIEADGRSLTGSPNVAMLSH